jgi:DNA adenine methylase
MNAPAAIVAPTRPALRWHGGKWKLAPWIISHFPPHRVYVEPFGGAASVLLRKPQAVAEVWNDLDRDVVTLFRVLQRPADAARLIELLTLTPFARAEFQLAYELTDDPVEASRRLVVRSFMGMGAVSNALGSKATGFRNNALRNAASPNGALPVHDWAGYPDCLEVIVERFREVIIESLPAPAVIKRFDAGDALIYLDPPYLPETRSKAGRAGTGYVAYSAEMNAAEHAELLGTLCKIEGMAVLSGYPSALYDESLPDWRRVETKAHADGARPRTEVLWINPQACDALDRARNAGGLFASHTTGDRRDG